MVLLSILLMANTSLLFVAYIFFFCEAHHRAYCSSVVPSARLSESVRRCNVFLMCILLQLFAQKLHSWWHHAAGWWSHPVAWPTSHHGGWPHTGHSSDESCCNKGNITLCFVENVCCTDRHFYSLVFLDIIVPGNFHLRHFSSKTKLCAVDYNVTDDALPAFSCRMWRENDSYDQLLSSVDWHEVRCIFEKRWLTRLTGVVYAAKSKLGKRLVWF